MLFIFLYITLCILAAVYVGTKRKIGQVWTLFFCVTFSILIGIFIALASPKISDKNDKKSGSTHLTIIFAVIAIILLAIFILIVRNPDTTQLQASCLALLMSGFFGAAIYSKDSNLITMG